MNVSELRIQFTINHDFESIEWFKLNNLPSNTHPGVFYALWFFGFWDRI